MKVHAEIIYKDIHSDICPKDCEAKNMKDKEYRQFLHTCLNEWLDKSKGEGIFYIGNEKDVQPLR